LKALLISDVHANIYALEAIWKVESDSEIIYCAGDLVDYGPFPSEVIGWMRERRAICVQGNHDKDVADAYRKPESFGSLPGNHMQWKHHNASKLGEDDILFLESLPGSVTFEMDCIGYSLQHMYRGYDTIASLPQFTEFWRRQTEGNVRDASCRRLIFGHTHRRCVHLLSDRDLWMNSGSVSYRRTDDPSKEAHYITITDGRIELKSVDYDRSPLLRAVKALSLSEPEMAVAFKFFG
jgi:predicted phosphodiesterase